MERKQRGHFQKKYSRRKPEVFTRPALEPDTNTDTSGVDSGQAKGVTTPAGNSPQTSTGKGSEQSAAVQGKGERLAENQSPSEPNAVQSALAVAEQETFTPSRRNKELAGKLRELEDRELALQREREKLGVNNASEALNERFSEREEEGSDRSLFEQQLLWLWTNWRSRTRKTSTYDAWQSKQ